MTTRRDLHELHAPTEHLEDEVEIIGAATRLDSQAARASQRSGEPAGSCCPPAVSVCES
jgi:hypothetical protein